MSVLFFSFHLEFFQHGRLICKAQVAAADAKLSGQVVEVHLEGTQRIMGGAGRICGGDAELSGGTSTL